MTKYTIPIMPLWAYFVGSAAAFVAGVALGTMIGMAL